MKNSIFFIFIISISFFSCQNASKTPKQKEIPEEIPQKMETTMEKIEKPILENVEEKATPNSSKNSTTELLIPSETEGVDFWTARNCNLKKPKPTILNNKQPGNYSFKINERQGYGKEVLGLVNGYKLDITSKGCNSLILTYSYFFHATELDVKDTKAVSEKIIELLEMVSKISNPPINIKKRIPALKGAVEQIGPFQIGEEFILVDGEVKENFMLERLQERNGKIFLSYYFSKGPT